MSLGDFLLLFTCWMNIPHANRPRVVFVLLLLAQAAHAQMSVPYCSPEYVPMIPQIKTP